MSAEIEDETEWASAVRGHGESFGFIFDRHRDRVFRHSLRFVPVMADADDVVAIAFLEAWRRRDDVRFVDGSMLPWLLVTATNVARNMNRAARRHRALLNRLPPPVDAADHAELYVGDRAQAALRRLPRVEQEVLTLCVVLDMSEKDAAAVLGVAPGTIKSRLSRAKQRLRTQLDVPSSALLKEVPDVH